MTVRHQKTVKTLLEAMPYIRRFWGATVVLKYGGAAMTSPRLQEQFAEDVVLLRLVGMKPIVVHGGGPEISRHMEQARHGARVRRRPPGHRRGDHGGRQDGARRQGEQGDRRPHQPARRHGRRHLRRGRPPAARHAQEAHATRPATTSTWASSARSRRSTPSVLDLLAEANIPVVASVGADDAGEAYNVNADTVAGELAAALHAEKIIFLTDVDGIYEDQGADVDAGVRVRPRLPRRAAGRRPHQRRHGPQGRRPCARRSRPACAAPTSSTAAWSTPCCSRS